MPASTYYHWRERQRRPSDHHLRDVELLEMVRDIHTRSGRAYGSPRVFGVLNSRGVPVSRERIERLTREDGLAGVSPRTHGRRRPAGEVRDPHAVRDDDLVNRIFHATAPDRLWVTDLTLVHTGEGPLWLSSIRDAFSRRVVAWETSPTADAELVLTALEHALASRRPSDDGSLVHHADHGTQYTSVKLTTRLLKAGIRPSMGTGLDQVP
ncbi:IS3 family transposase [Streptomyces sp. H27-G5]|uniref:IS3 family transposase n=1 Tax=Streptomyces sp. H27-G5 TaxID=2996698 RepID=UPI00226E5D61|nr:IS3 family transposase [Streptomyces sp. H27-G5]MCY0924337.1 IS3 family transposase [Streptomyces sp. H27-G5]